jgi:glucose uptake protein GlcU
MRFTKLAIGFFAVNLLVFGALTTSFSKSSNGTANLKASSRHAIIIADGTDPLPRPPKA